MATQPHDVTRETRPRNVRCGAPVELDVTEVRPLGSSDLRVSSLCLGGNVFGWTADQTQSFAVLDAYLAAGGNFVDTADSYMNYFPSRATEPG
ncbi:aldo/keto reductase [Nonomuraea sp. NPDC003709]|uniref:aldo/keto reductase n=1 Tax=Nonomuraea sp. NPDC003709 TaxID=3154450 RepID=UPI0033BF48B2